MNQRVVPVVGAVVLSLVTASRVAASTGGELSPTSASPGAIVKYENGCLGIVDSAPPEAKVGFSRTGDTPDGDLPTTNAKRTATFTYVFAVPDLAPGDYVALLECAPGNWATNNAEPGGPATLTVLPASANASTSGEEQTIEANTATDAASPTVDPQVPGAPVDGAWLVIGLSSGLAGAWAIRRRLA
jgi:hypothetical protein